MLFSTHNAAFFKRSPADTDLLQGLKATAAHAYELHMSRSDLRPPQYEGAACETGSAAVILSLMEPLDSCLNHHIVSAICSLVDMFTLKRALVVG